MKSPPEAPPSKGTSAWHRARVGDRVVYSFSANRAPGRSGGEARAVAGRLVLEVVAVQQPWAWLKLSFTDDAGKPLSNPRLARELHLPMRMDASRPLEVPREGTESVEQPSAAGRTWEAKRYVRDNRPSDGPMENRLYAVSPGPLYLTNGLLDASTTLSGFGDTGGNQLTLVEVRQGAEGGTATAPALERPFGPGTWYDLRLSMPDHNGVERTCFSAEQGHVLRVQGPAPTAGGEPCPSFAEAEVVPLEQSLMELLSEAIGTTRWPPPKTTATSRGTFSGEGRNVASLTFDTPETEGSTRKVRYETYAADPWDASLAGLAQEARFRTLTEGVDRLGAKGKREPEAFTKLSAWGVWAGSAK
ncbi:DUF6068 family protein [Hyalangium rubrum]|uniref:DUF6068 family protein n=1 Tax=Hyalangium rubrum TaxID=3103134 RepID=A0ABU5GXH2_9BACT|nr:DUF6068 family protein [Hyalangium sp. s54d21]MDY7225889.1 DUF6068 family protein [Hyalangium sp. s54d21]